MHVLELGKLIPHTRTHTHADQEHLWCLGALEEQAEHV